MKPSYRTFLAVMVWGCFLSALPLFSQETETVEERLQRISEAVASDLFEKALTLIEEGLSAYPEEYRFPMVRGDLYKEQELYSLALESYREAETLDRFHSVELRKQLASTLAYLDQNFLSLSYLEALMDEGELSVLDDLGWMYYKTYQPEKGIALIRESLENEFDRNLSLTLGTLYSELNNADLCRKYYLDAIGDAEDHQDFYFASVGYYNLSLAEKSFYNYDAAVDYARESLELMDRSAGHLALGDLYMMKQSFPEAEREFREAVDLDKTPLSRTNLASLYKLQGRLDESLEEIKKIEQENDASWMYYYGLNQDQFMMDLYRQYYEVYEAKVQQQILMKEWTVSAKIKRYVQLIKNKGRSIYYRILNRLISFREGQSQLQGGAELRGNLTLGSGAEGFSRQAEKYYLRALALEGLPRSEPWYDLVIGRELRDKERLARAEESLDQEWEKQLFEDALRSRVLLMRAASQEKDDILRRMYQMNPGSLVQYGLRLPLELQISGKKATSLQVWRVKRLLNQSGFRLIATKGNSLVLRINLSESIQYSLTDLSGRVLYSGQVPLESRLSEELETWIHSFRKQVFQF